MKSLAPASPNSINMYCRSVLILALSCLLLPGVRAGSGPAGRPPKQGFYSIKIYQLKSKEQENRLDKFLKEAYLPALHRIGIPLVGVFRQVGNDTAAIRRVYVLVPFNSLEQCTALPLSLAKDKEYLATGKDYLDASYEAPAYHRIESILLQAFPDAPRVTKPEAFQTPSTERIYELRSYEGPTENYFANKVQMFNEGGEIGLFKRLGFNAVFYASVLSGAHMPNLMYMTSFENMASREAHWKAFGADPFWKQLAALPEYQHNVSHIDIVFLLPAEYSDL